MLPFPSPSGVRAAADLLRRRVVSTPVLESRLLNAELGGGRLLVKAECLQHTGSFKYRGALHRLIRLQADDPEAAVRGVVAFSSGNFGQALAAAATSLGVHCTIVSPHDAPPLKLERIEKYGARLRTSTALPNENREVVASALAQQLSVEEGLTLLHPFDDAHVIHGQGTIGMEFLEQARQLLSADEAAAAKGLGRAASPPAEASAMDMIVVPCGGGGMTAGICLSVEDAALQNRTAVMTVEPTGFDDHARSFRASRRLSLAEIYDQGGTAQVPAAPLQPPRSRRGFFPSASGPAASSPPAAAARSASLYPIPVPRERSVACDALMASAPGALTWSVNGPRLSGAVAVADDAAVGRAMKVAFDHFRLVLEPSGALALAAVLDGLVPLLEVDRTGNDTKQHDGVILPPGKVIGIIACGGNTDLHTFSRMTHQ